MDKFAVTSERDPSAYRNYYYYITLFRKHNKSVGNGVTCYVLGGRKNSDKVKIQK